MVDFNIDTSSYPKAAPVQQQNPLDTISKLQGIQRQQIGISKDKLDLYNAHWDNIQKILGHLANKPDLESKDFVDELQKAVKSGAMTPEQYATEISALPSLSSIQRKYPNATPEQHNQILQQQLKQTAENHLIAGTDRNAQINWYAGNNPRMIDVGEGQVPAQEFRGAIRPTGPMVKTGLQPNTQQFIPPGKDAQGNDIGTGRNAPIGEANPQDTFRGNALPVAGSTAPIVPNRVKTVKPPPLPIGPDYSPVNPARNAAGKPNNLTGPETPMIGSPPMGTGEAVEGGLKAYQEASANSGKILNRVKPAQQAIRLMDPEVIKGLTGTGPIAEKASSILSALQGVGLVSKGTDRVAQRQELVKNLAGYLSQSPSAQRSDEAQALAAKANANPDYHLLPTLIDVTRRNIARDRIMAAAPLAFKNFDEKTGKTTQRTDWHNFTSHNSEFPNSVDERAFMLDSMPEKERKSFIQNMLNNTKGEEKAKFVRSMKLAQRLNMYEP